MLTDAEVKVLWPKLALACGMIDTYPGTSKENTCPVKEIDYIAQASNGTWIGLKGKPPRYSANSGNWTNGGGEDHWRWLAVMPLHEGHDTHYYEVASSRGDDEDT